MKKRRAIPATSFLQALPKQEPHKERYTRNVRVAAIIWFSSDAHGAPPDDPVAVRLIDGDFVHFRAGDLRRALGIAEPTESNTPERASEGLP